MKLKFKYFSILDLRQIEGLVEHLGDEWKILM